MTAARSPPRSEPANNQVADPDEIHRRRRTGGEIIADRRDLDTVQFGRESWNTWARAIDPIPKAAKQALWFLEEAREQCGAYPGMAVGLVVLCMALGLPRRSAVALWSVSRAAGQIAHVLEQRMQGFILRPRAKYSGRSSVPA
jgi:hypothetical protein